MQKYQSVRWLVGSRQILGITIGIHFIFPVNFVIERATVIEKANVNLKMKYNTCTEQVT